MHITSVEQEAAAAAEAAAVQRAARQPAVPARLAARHGTQLKHDQRNARIDYRRALECMKRCRVEGMATRASRLQYAHFAGNAASARCALIEIARELRSRGMA